MKKFGFAYQYQWRILLLRILVNALALFITTIILPKIYFVNFSIASLLVITLVMGIVNALVRPILQFLTIRFLFVSFGLVIVFVDVLILYLVAFIVPNRFAITSLFWAFIGGLIIGVLGNFLENFFGISEPILPDETKELRKQIAEQDPSILRTWIQEAKTARKLRAEEAANALPEPEAAAEPVEETEVMKEPTEEPSIASRGEK